jgi:hypothetical protein
LRLALNGWLQVNDIDFHVIVVSEEVELARHDETLRSHWRG